MNSFRAELVALINKWLAAGDTPISIMKELSNAGAKISEAAFAEPKKAERT